MQQENRQKLVEAGMKRWEIGEIASRIARLYYGQYQRTSESSYLAEAYIFYEAILSREYFRDKFKEWKQIVQEISRFLKVDTNFMNMRPLRYSYVFDSPPGSLPCISNQKGLKLRDAILVSYHHNEVKFTELTLDTFRMLQCLEWEPLGSFSLTNGDDANQEGSSHSRMNPLQDIRDPSLPPNPQKVILYRPSVTHYLVVLATLCEELPPDGILLIYLAAPGSLEACSPAVSFSQSSSESKELQDNNRECCLHLGPYVNEGLNCLYPCDLVPFTRKPLFLIIDSNASDAFKAGYVWHGEGGAVAMLLSPKSPSFPTGATADSAVSQNGSQFTMFLTAPLQAFCSLLGVANSTIDKKDAYSKAEELLLMILNEWGRALVSSGSLAPIWIEVLGDLFLRRLLLRFIFCRAVLALRSATPAPECLPECLPQLPDCTLPGSPEIQRGVRRLAEFFGIAGQFSLSSDPSPPNSGSGGGGPEDPAI
ncbi:unnamed protein product [Spirodela intermedia]|uniref:Uncharacterized protein n=1 Tax=Spirodela intermedia TaxID=51605 RepID=A0A7I8JHL3_SPIIN|nr:unnamed protein product [Spirodela intermedia]CAA6669659.1 unnamed protein product [Spirodela intermedia]